MADDSQSDFDFSAPLPDSVREEISAGMRQADDNANERWKHIFDGCVLAAARKKPRITSDEVLDEIEALPNAPSTHNLKAIGPAMVRAAEMGVLERTEEVVRSRRKGKNGNRHNVWRSLYYMGEGEKR